MKNSLVVALMLALLPGAVLPADAEGGDGPKVYISVDMEGTVGAVTADQLEGLFRQCRIGAPRASGVDPYGSEPTGDRQAGRRAVPHNGLLSSHRPAACGRRF